jgi:hypothetical protein
VHTDSTQRCAPPADVIGDQEATQLAGTTISVASWRERDAGASRPFR